MCNICEDYKKGTLTKQEAKKNVGEILSVPANLSEEEYDHLAELEDDLYDEDNGDTD